MFKNIKLLHAVLAVFVISLHANSAMAMDEHLNENSAIQTTNYYYGAQDFMDKFENGKYKAFGEQFYRDLNVKVRGDDFEKYKGYCIFENSSPIHLQSFQVEGGLYSYILGLIDKGTLKPAATVSAAEATPPCPGYYCIPGVDSGRDASDVYYVKTSEVERAVWK
ncbi:MAG: hypothetical protein ACOH2E_03450 [Candidatus Paracaedibacter sp.]